MAENYKIRQLSHIRLNFFYLLSGISDVVLHNFTSHMLIILSRADILAKP